MMKLKWQLRLRLWLWQQRRLLILSGACLLATVLLFSLNTWLLASALPAMAVPLLTFGQLCVAGLLVTLVLIVSD